MLRPNARRILALGAVTAAISAGAIAAPVFAEGATTTTGTTATTQTASASMQGPGSPARPSAFDAAVAAHLGITAKAFEAAEQAVRGTLAPPAGTINGISGFGPAATQAAFDAKLAGKLGITKEQLTAAEEAANQALILKNLSSLVTHGALTQAQATALRQAATNGTFDQVLRAQEIARLSTRVNAALKAGRITQAQAAQILKDAQTAPLTGPGGRLGLGFCGPGGAMGPGGTGAPLGSLPPHGTPDHGAGMRPPV